MLKEIELQELVPSPTNPRKTFDQAKLEELARSITSKGVLEPLLVRPHANGGAAAFEIVAGERRFRAAALAEVPTIPCIVRELDDVDVLEIQTIENLQRDDVHPLEEAEGYAALMKAAGYDVAEIAGRIGKSGKYVYDRLKLLQLVPELREVFLAGEITVAHAVLLARLTPTEQERALTGGLFQHDVGRTQPGLELDDAQSRKARSVRELATWIDDHVRFRPEEVDLPNLFPETAAALEKAEEAELKVVHITREYRVADSARDSKRRTYGSNSWKRADGEPEYEWWSSKPKPSKTCEHSVLGVVVAGEGRGQAFPVCVAKKKCKVHWEKEQKEAAARRANGAGAAGQSRADADRKWREEEAKRKAERARWKKAKPKLLEALAEKLKETPPEKLVDIVLDGCVGYGQSKKTKRMPRGKTVDDGLRLAAFLVLSRQVSGEWRAPQHAPMALKRVGIDAKKIVDQVAPKPKGKKRAPAKAKKASQKKAPPKRKTTAAKAKQAPKKTAGRSS